MRWWHWGVAGVLVAVGCGRTSTNPHDGGDFSKGMAGTPASGGGAAGDTATSGGDGPMAQAPNCAVALAAHDGRFCAAYQDGSVWCWGAVIHDGPRSFLPSLEPRQVAGLSQIESLTLGERHDCALDVEGRLWCWGDNDQQQIAPLADTSLEPTAVLAPEALTFSLGLGPTQTCALDRKGDVRCWGRDASGARSPEPQVVHRAAPRSTLGPGPDFFDEQGRVIDFSTWTNPLALQKLGANNARHAVGPLGNPECLLKRSGSVWCTNEVDGVFLALVSIDIGAHALKLEVGDGFACVLLDNGSVWCGGWNNLGQLGHETDGNAALGLVTGLTGVVALAAGTARTCALRLDGSVWCWGATNDGKSQVTPTQLSGCDDQRQPPRAIEPDWPSDPAWRLADAARARAQALCGCVPVNGPSGYAACIETEDRSPHAACLAALLPGEKALDCLSNEVWDEARCYQGCNPACPVGSCPPVIQSGALRYCQRDHRCEPDATPLARSSVCNGVRDCADGSDERNCSPAQGYFECIDGSTIEVIQVCDQHVDCADGSDESRCL